MSKIYNKILLENYKGKYDPKVCKELFQSPTTAGLEEMRTQYYGYVFTEEYKNHEIPDIFDMDYWDDLYGYDSPQSQLLIRVIESTGDGKTPETAFSVISVGDEYAFMERKAPYFLLERKKQSVKKISDRFIDCIEFKENMFGVNELYFDVTAFFKH